MKTKVSRAFKCFKYLVISYLVLIFISGISIAVFTSYLLIFRHESLIWKARIIVISFLVIPLLLTVSLIILGWESIKRKNINLLKFICSLYYSPFGVPYSEHSVQFAVLLILTDILQIAGCLWCFISIPKINEDLSLYLKEEFANGSANTFSQNWWNNIEIKLKCCGLHGPTDYSSAKAVPISCCGYDPEDETKGSCTFLWQKGCSSAIRTEISDDFILLGLIALGVTFLQIPGIFISWCFAKRMSKESL